MQSFVAVDATLERNRAHRRTWRMATVTDTSRIAATAPREDTRPRWRFAASLGLYGASIGAAVVIVNLVGLTSKFAVDADYLPPEDILYFMIVGGLTGFTVAGLVGYLINRSSRAFASSAPRPPLGVLAWAAVGATYWVAFSFLVGAITLPQANVISAYANGAISFVDFIGFTLDTIFGAPFHMVSEGGRFMYTAIPAGLLFALGGWAIDRIAASSREQTARYGPPATAAALSAIVIAAVLLLPPSILWHIGNLTTATQVYR